MAEQAAKVTVTGTAKNPVFNIDIPTGAKGERGAEGPMGPVGPLPQPVVGEVITASNPADDIWMADIVRNSPSVSAAFKEIFPASMQGLKGDKGGWDNGTSLNSVDLNTITVPGIYHQWNTNLGNKTLNYPLNGIAGTLHVSRWSGSEGAVLQEFVSLGSGGVETAAQRPRVLAHRYFGNKWSDWSIVVPQRIDNTAGRAIYTWDETANREQLIYGDTGWRSVNANSRWTSFALQHRRVGSMCEIKLVCTAPVGLTAPVELHAFQLLKEGELPAYIKPTNGAYGQGIGRVGTTNKRQPVMFQVYNNLSISLEKDESNSEGTVVTSNSIFYISHTYMTSEPWPTTLAGTANGSVPNL